MVKSTFATLRRGTALRFLLALVAAFAALPPAVGDAAPPVLNTVGHTTRHLTAIWTLPPGVEAAVIEAATSPETSTDGYFFFENVEEFSTLAAGQTTYTGNLQLDPGTYYVHVGGYDPPCLGCPAREFSAIQVLTVPPDPPPPLKLTFGDARRYVKVALRRRFARTYAAGYAKRVSSCTRRSPTRVRCLRVSWIVGDLSYKGWVTIRLAGTGDAPVWRYSYRIKLTDHYCIATDGRRCTKVHREPS